MLKGRSMDSKHIKKIKHDNKILKEKLDALKLESDSIKSSKAYKTIRVIGKLRDEFRKSPSGFGRKIVKKIGKRDLKLSAGNYINSVSYAAMIQAEYEEWISLNEPHEIELIDQKVDSDRFLKKPLISIITPVFNPPKDVFIELIESVLNQTYPNFELCLGNFGDNQDIAEIIKVYASKDSRVKTWKFSANLGIAENSNQILKKIKGDYIALLDHDDTLSPDALYENVKLINQDTYDFIYSDKDKINEAGERFDPFFKPDWSPEMMLNVNYLTHLNVMRASVVKKIGGWRKDTDGAQDWDLFLRVINASDKKVGHISKVLYHWRVIATSTAMSIDTKPYALKGQRVAVDTFLKQNKIKASSYHVGAELLLRWPESKKRSAKIIISSSSAQVRYALPNKATEPYYVISQYEVSKSLRSEFPFVNFIETESVVESLKDILKAIKDGYVTIYHDTLKPLSDEVETGLLGWASVPGVVAAAPIITDDSDRILDAGAIYQDGNIKQIFAKPLPYLQTPLGNIEWVRNLSIVSSSLLMVDCEVAIKALTDAINQVPEEDLLVLMQVNIKPYGRLVFDPKLKAHSNSQSHYYPERNLGSAFLFDQYSNINIDCTDTIHIRAIPRGLSNDDDIYPDMSGNTYSDEALAHSNNITIDETDLLQNSKTIRQEHEKRLEYVNSALFILPGFSAIYAGLNNIFNYVQFLSVNKGIKTSIAILDSPDKITQYKEIVIAKFPNLHNVSFISTTIHTADELPRSDIAICTQWATAYVLAKYNKTKRKCYFIQDKEASFYPKGTISALAEFTYKLNFYALANTPGLLEWYKREFGGDGFVVKSMVSLDKYKPSLKTRQKKPYKVFFYGRPNEPRNAFELGISALTLLKKQLGNQVEIFSAGADWSEEEYNLEGIVKNLGKIPYDSLPKFYRSMDAGVMFMFSGHPGVVASELMASGCPVVVNEYNDKTWNDLYRNNETCLVAHPTPSSVYECLMKILTDNLLRESIKAGGLVKVKEFYAGYEESLEQSFADIQKPLLMKTTE